jgi:hypothetical protein
MNLCGPGRLKLVSVVMGGYEVKSLCSKKGWQFR